MIQPNEQTPIAVYATKQTPLIKHTSNPTLMERIKQAISRKEEFKEKESLLRNDYGTFP